MPCLRFLQKLILGFNFLNLKFTRYITNKQDAYTGVHSACRREENGNNLHGYLGTTYFLVLK